MKKHSRHNRWWYDQIYEGLNMTCSLSFQLWAQICPKYSVVGRWEGRRGGFKYGGMVGADEARHPNILDVFQPQYWLSCTVFWDQKKTCILVKSVFFCSQVNAWVLIEHMCWLCPYSSQVNRRRSPCIARDVVKLSTNSWLCRCQQQLHFVIPSHVSPDESPSLLVFRNFDAYVKIILPSWLNSFCNHTQMYPGTFTNLGSVCSEIWNKNELLYQIISEREIAAGGMIRFANHF